jgi:hypothetical protein
VLREKSFVRCIIVRMNAQKLKLQQQNKQLDKNRVYWKIFSYPPEVD